MTMTSSPAFASACPNRTVHSYCTCRFPPDRLIHVTECVTFYPRAHLYRVDDTLYITNRFAWGMHTWDHLAGLANNKEKIVSLRRHTFHGCRPGSFCLNIRFSAVEPPDEYTLYSVLICDNIRATHHDVLMSVYVRRIQRAMRRCLASRNLAVAMAMHARLGQASPFKTLCPDLLRKILSRGRAVHE